MTLKILSLKEKVDKLDFIKIKFLCSARHYQGSKKIRYRLRENIFKRHI
jgi:hypothetical protein